MVYAGHLMLIGEWKLEITVDRHVDRFGRQNTRFDEKSLGKRKTGRSWNRDDNTKMNV